MDQMQNLLGNPVDLEQSLEQSPGWQWQCFCRRMAMGLRPGVLFRRVAVAMNARLGAWTYRRRCVAIEHVCYVLFG